MYQLFKIWIDFVTSGSGQYTGLSLSAQEQTLLYGAIVLSIIMVVFFADLIYRVIRSFIRR